MTIQTKAIIINSYNKPITIVSINLKKFLIVIGYNMYYTCILVRSFFYLFIILFLIYNYRYITSWYKINHNNYIMYNTIIIM